ncbi:hypothetical protein KKG63_03685 [Patescibacteria group bacterium]|nr:hypothetical protein [Patescibacteria group bacterium]
MRPLHTELHAGTTIGEGVIGEGVIGEGETGGGGGGGGSAELSVIQVIPVNQPV